MAFLKFTADNIFTGTEMLGAGHVLVTTENGTIENIVPLSEAGDDVQYHPGILSPGFVNCHCHLELSHLKGVIPEKTGLVDFVITVMQQRNFPLEAILEAIEKAEVEMLQNGIVAVGDICNTAHTLAQKQQRKLHYYNFVEASGFVPLFAQQRFQQAVEVFNQLATLEPSTANGQPTPPPNIRHPVCTSIVPHAPYSTSMALMALINAHSAGKVVTIHNQETKQEEGFFISGESDFRKLFVLFNIDISFYKPSGKTSVQTYLPWLNKAGNLILVHNTFISEEDMGFVSRESSVGSREASIVNGQNTASISTDSPQLETENRKPETFFCLCPSANLYIENTLAPVAMLRQYQDRIILGTDSLASNHSLSILKEINTIQKHFPYIPVQELLRWATSNGAKALQMDSTLGSFDRGKKPGVVCVDGDLEQYTKLRRLI